MSAIGTKLTSAITRWMVASGGTADIGNLCAHCLVGKIDDGLTSRRYFKPALLRFRRVDTKSSQCVRVKRVATSYLIPDKQSDLIVGLLLHRRLPALGWDN